MDKINLVAIFSAFISILGALFSWTQARYTKKGYFLQDKIYKDGNPKISLCVINSFYKLRSEKIYYTFEIDIFNNSEKPNSIKEVCLILKCSGKNIKLKSCNNIDFNESMTFTKLPLNISSKSSIKCCLQFEIKKNIHDKQKIETHFIEVIDIDENIFDVEEIFVEKDK